MKKPHQVESETLVKTSIKEVDVVHDFIVTERNLVEPNLLLAEIREAIAQEKSSGDFKLTFNDYRITIVDKKIRLKSYYFGSEKLVEFSEFEERLLAFYKEFPYYSGE